jgi:cell division protein FtsQ
VRLLSPASTAGSQARVRRRADPWKIAFFALAGCAILAAAGWVLLMSSLFAVRSVRVTGNHLVPTSRVRAVAAVPPGTALIRVNTSAVARRVETISQVQSAQVSRAWPDGILIVVRERTAVLALPSGRRYELLDDTGVVLRTVPRRPAGMPLLSVPAGVAAAVRGSPVVRAAALVLHQLPGRVRHRVALVSAPSPVAITVRLRDGVTIVWGSPARGAVKAAELRALMRTRSRYYDLSDPVNAVTGH